MGAKETIKTAIVKFLEENGPQWQGKIEDYTRANLGTKGDTTARRCRELMAIEKIICEKRQVDGKGPNCNFCYLPKEIQKEEKGIDWSKDNLADALGRPDLKKVLQSSLF